MPKMRSLVLVVSVSPYDERMECRLEGPALCMVGGGLPAECPHAGRESGHCRDLLHYQHTPSGQFLHETSLAVSGLGLMRSKRRMNFMIPP